MIKSACVGVTLLIIIMLAAGCVGTPSSPSVAGAGYVFDINPGNIEWSYVLIDDETNDIISNGSARSRDTITYTGDVAQITFMVVFDPTEKYVNFDITSPEGKLIYSTDFVPNGLNPYMFRVSDSSVAQIIVLPTYTEELSDSGLINYALAKPEAGTTYIFDVVVTGGNNEFTWYRSGMGPSESGKATSHASIVGDPGNSKIGALTVNIYPTETSSVVYTIKRSDGVVLAYCRATVCDDEAYRCSVSLTTGAIKTDIFPK